MRPITLWRVRWEREDAAPYRSRRFATRARAVRFAHLLLDDDAQERWGDVTWVSILRADGFLGPWREVQP